MFLSGVVTLVPLAAVSNVEHAFAHSEDGQFLAGYSYFRNSRMYIWRIRVAKDDGGSGDDDDGGGDDVDVECDDHYDDGDDDGDDDDDAPTRD